MAKRSLPESISRRKQRILSRINDDLNIVDVSIPHPSTSSASAPLIKWNLISTDEPLQSKRLNATEQWSTFKVVHNFQSLPNLLEYGNSIDNAFEEAMKPFTDTLQSKDKIGFYIENETMNGDKRIYIRPQSWDSTAKRRFLNRIEATAQSGRHFLNSGLFNVRVLIVRSLTGFGRGLKAPVSYGESIKNKTSIIRIHNTDNSCGYRAIAIGIKWHEWEVKGNGHQPCWRHLIERSSAQDKVLFEFCETYGFDPRKPVDNDILKVIDEKLIDYQIIVIHKTNKMFNGTDRQKVIYLLFDDNHYDLITSMPGLLCKRIYCKYCNRGYFQAIQHRCEGSCYLCRSPFKCLKGTPKQCKDCGVTFVSQECFSHHLVSKICKDRHFCAHCEVIYTVEPKHKHFCHEHHCNTCGVYYSIQPHYCYMTPLNQNKITDEDQKTKVLIAYDIESMLDKTGNQYTHTPILLISHTICDTCLKTGTCELCLGKERVFYGEDCVQRFVQYLLDFSRLSADKKASITAFAHNSSGYDGHFILRELIRRDIKITEPTLNGTKIMKLDVGNIRFIDSLLLFQRPLAELPKMFDLTGEVKGFFPHYANTSTNQSLVCKLQDISTDLFDRQHMSISRAAEFDIWYSENSQMVYNLREEMTRYCRSDVRILLDAMISFRTLFIEITEIDPLSRCFTLASIGMEFFRAQLLTRDTIGITPIGGYNNSRKQSHSANAWLDMMAERFGGKMIREFKIGNYFADGVIEQVVYKNGKRYDKIAFEYNGCHWHGHNCGHNFNAKKFAEVEERKEYFLRQSVWPEFVWECDWLQVATQEFYIRKAYYKRMKEENLYADPRAALKGGRTNNLKFSYTAKVGEEIRYLDFTSLYPYVLSHYGFPGGHPEVYRSNFPSIDSVFGFVSCKVLPPPNLYLPVLPYTTNGKLTFPLCRTCAENQNQYSCPHSSEERSFTGTFVSEELQKALELGYKIVETYEVLHYEDRITDLFKEYVKRWYKIKAEASGFPADKKSPEDKAEYLKEFEIREKFALDVSKVKRNTGLRTTAKLMLNSFWGKLAQRPDLPITKIVKEYEELWDLLDDETIEIIGEVLIEEQMILSFKYKDVQNARVGNTSVAIASFVTAYARLELYNALEEIEDKSEGSVLYFDTDSIIYVQKNGGYKPEIGNFLGQMTDEIREEYGMDAKMTEFYSTGPKSYAYRVDTLSGPQFKLKAKGLTQNIESLDVLNFEMIKMMAQKKANEIPVPNVSVPQQQFRSNKQHIVTSSHLDKLFTVTSDKRRVIGNDTLPYGYIDNDILEFSDLMCY